MIQAALPFVIWLTVGIYLTGFLCRFSRRRHWTVGWYLAFVGPIAVGLFAMLLVASMMLFALGEIRPDRGPEILGATFIRAYGCSLLPALFVVWYYRKRSRDAELGA